MTTKAHAPAPAPVKKMWLNLAPLQLPDAICSDCGSRMFAVPLRDKKGRIEQNKVTFYCDTCECGFEAQLVYLNGMNVKYVSPKDRQK